MASLAEAAAALMGGQSKVPADVDDRIKRGRARMLEGATERNECLQFWRGNQYVYRTKDNTRLLEQDTSLERRTRHRPRQSRNLLVDIVRHEVSAAVSRVPSYEVSPSTTDPEDIGAARLAEKVALYGYDAWHVRRAVEKAVTYAVVASEAFVWPYFDNTIGVPIDDEVSTGDIRLRVFGPNEVYWEPGCKFEDSNWHCVEQARPLEAVYATPGYTGGKLTPDANTSEVFNRGKSPENSRMVLVTEYLERPCRKYPKGRRVIIANGKVIAPIEHYPCVDPDGYTVDEPCLHKLAYIIDPDSDRDMGLVRHCLDAQRTINNCTNRQLQWIQLALNPQVIAPPGSLRQQLTDEPGAVFEAIPVNGQLPQWRPTPAMPGELSAIKEEARRDIHAIAAQNEVPSQVESGRGIQAIIERDANARGAFIAQLAEFHSRLMRHCLYLVQRHYTEPRLLKIRGRFGPEQVRDFYGAQLRGQCDIRVFPGSIEPRTKAAIEARVLAFADRGWISPQAAMAAINGGTAEKLIEDYELDVSWQNHEIQQIMAIADGGIHVPDARRFDNHKVHLDVLHSWMKTSDFANAHPDVQEAAMAHEEQHQLLLAEEEAKAAEAQAAQAEAHGMRNAAKPQGAKPMPDLPGQQPPELAA